MKGGHLLPQPHRGPSVLLPPPTILVLLTLSLLIARPQELQRQRGPLLLLTRPVRSRPVSIREEHADSSPPSQGSAGAGDRVLCIRSPYRRLPVEAHIHRHSFCLPARAHRVSVAPNPIPLPTQPCATPRHSDSGRGQHVRGEVGELVRGTEAAGLPSAAGTLSAICRVSLASSALADGSLGPLPRRRACATLQAQAGEGEGELLDRDERRW